MKASTRNILILELIMFFVLIISFFQSFLFEHYLYLIFLCLLGGGAYFLIGIDTRKSETHKTTIKSVLICVIAYFMFIYILGLYVDFAKTIYSISFVNLIKNILPAITVILVSESLRYQFIQKSNKNKFIITFSFIIFVLLECCIGYYNYNLHIKDQLYQFIGTVVLAGISKNILMTIIDLKSDFYVAIYYRLIMELYVFIVPIVPDLGIYVYSVFLITFPILISVFLISSDKKKLKTPYERRKGNIIFTIVTILLFILVALNSGLFKYHSLVIGSQSMQPTFSKGDVVVIKKLNKKEKNEIKKGDIIVFRYDDKYISHRVYKVHDRGEYRFYQTKGDNNSQPDADLIENANVVGTVKVIVKKVGLPSIWLNEVF